MHATKGSRAAPEDEVLDLKAAAAAVGYEPQSLRTLRFRPDPPPSFKIGARLFFRRGELEAWARRRNGVEL